MTSAAFKATYVDARPYRGLKIVRFMFDVAVEDSTDALAILGGFPRPDEPVYVGIAPIKEGATKAVSEAPKPANDVPKEHRPFNEWPPSQQAFLRCQDINFRAFLRATYPDRGPIRNAEHAAELVRSLCGVASRADILLGTQAGGRWLLLMSAFEAWVREPIA
jgi:hypothetical protein